MSVINLKITSRVLDHVANVGHSSRKQIAYEVVDGQLYERNSEINKRHKVTIKVANQITLTLGDTSAIWFSHQTEPAQFEALYQLLSIEPDQAHSFSYQLI
ncbi:hypothetical protein [Vibrio neptunius]|uniref:hypothetical protein n=1 Tax=Vibrio neptunius TaxID=170651 RepID=UPI0019D1BEE8|nr:hypothetical protein [Vibrio neptunius]MBN3572272.1 hypothetical protein [Vibrio neptunius]QXX08531.1 hypothetical protein KW548_23280 [Vibrio neptunius]